MGRAVLLPHPSLTPLTAPGRPGRAVRGGAAAGVRGARAGARGVVPAGAAAGGSVIKCQYSSERAQRQLWSCVSVSTFSADLCLMTDSPSARLAQQLWKSWEAEASGQAASPPAEPDVGVEAGDDAAPAAAPVLISSLL
jgi:hypothetical protein